MEGGGLEAAGRSGRGEDSCAGWLRPPLEECLCHSVTSHWGDTNQPHLTSAETPFFLLLLLEEAAFSATPIGRCEQTLVMVVDLRGRWASRLLPP